jgi:dolichol-phosphate mannosyltransferase
MPDLREVYERRFPQAAEAEKDGIWPPIVRYLSRWIDLDAPVLDIACDRGYFIRNVSATERWAADLRDLASTLPPDIRFVQENGLNLARVLPNESFGTVFMSNYLEHLADADAVIEQLRVVRTLLRVGGNTLILQPNIRLVGGAYWDFIDHRVALTEKSLREAAELADLKVVQVITRFLPYSTAGRLPASPTLVNAYLRVPALWRVFGRQTLVVARRA